MDKKLDKETCEFIHATFNKFWADLMADHGVQIAEAVVSQSGYKPKPPVTIEDVRAALTELSGKHGAAASKKLMEPYQKLSDVPQTEWRYLIKTAKERL